MKKPLSRFRDDLEGALGMAVQRVAYDVTSELKKIGPYWTGQFEEAWIIEKGEATILPSILDKYKGNRPETPMPRKLTSTWIDQSNSGMKTNYTIGNTMEYAKIAMDMSGNRASRPGRTAKPYWFQNFFVSPEKDAIMSKAVGVAFNSIGWRRK